MGQARIARRMSLLLLLLLLAAPAGAAVLLGGGPRKNDCLVAVVADGLAFPAGGAKGVTCADGDACDADGTRDGVCHIQTAICFNVAADGCTAGTVSKLVLRGRQKGVTGAAGEAFFSQVTALGSAAASLLPASAPVCTPVAALPVYVHGPNGRGDFQSGRADLQLKARTSRGADRDAAQVVCLPSGGITPTTTSTTTTASTTTVTDTSTTTTTTTTTSTTTTTAGGSTTTTTLPGPPGAGLEATITSAAVAGDRSVTVTFTLTDTDGVPVTPIGSATTDERKARVRMTISRLEENTETVEGFSTTFTKYVCYITANQTSAITHVSSAQPTYDSGGTFATVDAGLGIYSYTFRTKLPQGYPDTSTHTIGAQIERTVDGVRSVANPVYDFVPAGGSVATTRHVVSTTACNGCHDPLALHGGGRRDVRLCQLCHTDQAIDPDTGNTLDLKVLIHKIHRGKDLPSVAGGAVGDHFSIIGFGGAELTWSEKTKACVSGAKAGLPCTVDGDCPSGTCTGTTTEGVGFPKDLRNCEACHTGAAQAAHYKEKPSAAGCASCHDDVNPSQVTTAAGAPGTNHVAGDQPDAFCRICHAPTGDEFDESVPGAHTVPLRSAILTGLQAEILSAAGTASNPVVITFRVKDAEGTPLDVRSGFNRVGLAISGPSADFGGASKVVITPTVVGGGSSGTLSAPDVDGIFTYTTSAGNALPADAAGTWRVGLEVRRSVTVDGASVSEAARNPVLDFSVDGSAVVHRRTVVETENCEHCHGQFSKDFSVHGNLRNAVEYCVVCHNPNVTDAARRIPVVATGADVHNASIDFKHMIHKIHTGEDLTQQPYVIYGFGSSANDFGEVRFPGNRADCAACHAAGTYLLPLDDGVLPTRVSVVDSGAESVTGSVAAITDACTSCHDDAATAAHAETNTTAGGAEACAVCHGEGSIAPVSEVHARAVN